MPLQYLSLGGPCIPYWKSSAPELFQFHLVLTVKSYSVTYKNLLRSKIQKPLPPKESLTCCTIMRTEVRSRSTDAASVLSFMQPLLRRARICLLRLEKLVAVHIYSEVFWLVAIHNTPKAKSHCIDSNISLAGNVSWESLTESDTSVTHSKFSQCSIFSLWCCIWRESLSHTLQSGSFGDELKEWSHHCPI